MSLPDGPKSPSIWQMFQWITMPFSFMLGCSHYYGDRFTVRIGQRLGPIVFFSNPEAMQVILIGDDSELFDAPGELNAVVEPLSGNKRRPASCTSFRAAVRIRHKPESLPRSTFRSRISNVECHKKANGIGQLFSGIRR
jgi:hypothetical protein